MKIQNTDDKTNNITNSSSQKIEPQKAATNPLMSNNTVSSNAINPNSFFDNITIAKPLTKSSGFTVEFNKE